MNIGVTNGGRTSRPLAAVTRVADYLVVRVTHEVLSNIAYAAWPGACVTFERVRALGTDLMTDFRLERPGAAYLELGNRVLEAEHRLREFVRAMSPVALADDPPPATAPREDVPGAQGSVDGFPSDSPDISLRPDPLGTGWPHQTVTVVTQ